MQPDRRSARAVLPGVAVVALAFLVGVITAGADRAEARDARPGVASGGGVGQEATPSCPGSLGSLTLAEISGEISVAGAGTYTLSCNYGVILDRGPNQEPGFSFNHARASVRWTEVVGGVPAATQSCGQDDQVIPDTSVGEIGQHHVYSDDSLARAVFDGEAEHAGAIEGLALSLLATVAAAAVPCDAEVYCPAAPSGMRLALRPFSYDVQSNGVAQYSCAYNAAPDGASPPLIQINPSWLAEPNDRVPASLFCVEERAGGPSGTMDYQKYVLDPERQVAVRYLGRESSEATALALANDVLLVVRERAQPCEASGEEAGSGLAVGTEGATAESAGGALSDSGGGSTDDGSAGGGEAGGSDGSETSAAGGDDGGALADLLLGEGTGAPDAGDAAMAAAVAAVIVILTTMGTAWATVPGFSDDVAAAIAAILDRLRGGGGQVAGASERTGGGTWVPPSTVNVQTGPETAVADFEPGVMDPADGPTRLDPDGPRVTPLDPGLPPVDGEAAGVGVPSVGAGEVVAPLPQEVIDRWAAVGADGQGRIFDRYGQQIGTIDRSGVVTDLNGNPVTAMTPEFGVTGFTDSQGRVIEYSESGVPMQRTETPRGPVFTPVEDLPTATDLRPDLDPGVQARWTGAGAGPEGELYGADGTVIGRIDTDGTMRTLDGRVITGYTEPVGGRLPEITLEGGERVRTPGAGPAPERVDIPSASGAGDDELADLVRRTSDAQAERAAAQGAETNAGTAVDGDTQASGPSEDTRVTTPQAEGDTRVAGPDGGATADGERVTDAPPPRSGETPGEVEGPRGGEALGTVLDAQGLLDQIEREMAAGRSAQEAITRAVASTWASNAVGDVGEGVTEMRTTLLASALLPDGVNNILPDQFAANTMNTGLDAWSAIVADVAASLGEGEVNSEALDEFARQLAERSGADPWSGYAQLGEAFGEELGEADMNPVTMFGNLAEDLARMDEQDVIVEQGLDAASRFEQEAFDGQHGTVLRGISEATRVATDPPDPEQFAEDATTIARVLWDDVTGGGDTGGMGPGFWEEIAEHNNDAVRGVPVVGTAFDGYAQIASGIEEQGVTGFSTEMAEGAAALAEEGATLAAETYAEARDAVFDQAVATYDAVARWF